MDRNSVIGFSLLAVLVIGYVSYNQHTQTQYLQQKHTDSVAYAKAHPVPVVDSSRVRQMAAPDNTVNDSIRRSLPAAFNGQAQTVTLENKKLILQFNTKGAYPVSALVKNYKTYSQQPLYLFNGKGNELSAILPVNSGAVATGDLYFTPVIKDEPNGDKTIDFGADMGNGKRVDIIYTLPADDYMMRCDIRLGGMPANTVSLNWNTAALPTEKDIATERLNSQVYYRYKNTDHDYFTIKSEDKKSLSDVAYWVGLRKQYFNSILVCKDGFNKVNIDASVKVDSNTAVVTKDVLEAPVKGNGTVSLQWYIGPNDYRILDRYKLGMEEMVPMGNGIMAFVKYINKWILLPLFFFLTSVVSNYGVIILILTLLMRLVLSFFTYKSYLSAAKMRVMKPELDELRKKHEGDQQKFGMEQMKLYRRVGVNPLGGCLPMLFQLPILFAMYYLFPSLIEFRQKSVLWAHDLSTYDSIAQLPFSIPLYGDHVSLFTLLMTASSLFLAVYNRNMTPQDPNNPMMKYMPFIFPFVFLGVFNKMAAALTLYYFVSNTLSILQQFVIQRYFINEKAIHAQLQENKNKPVAPSKWAQKMEELQKAQAERGKKK
ncbi:MAG: membrane protein insertase YidC [Taibaiella sp.]|nr:membrane protein insertase YidC [Taibaiella sp.]